ncbi:MAG: SIS domain-containing protein [Planctomycetota bacterium]
MKKQDSLSDLLKDLRSDPEGARTADLLDAHAEARAVYAELLSAHPALAGCVPSLLAAHRALVQAFAAGNKLLLCGNGGSFADALHLAAELLKSFERPRPLAPKDEARLRDLPLGKELVQHLEQGFPAVVLGTNPSFVSAILNDCEDPAVLFAQECRALGRAGDVLLGISTSGQARNVALAMTVGRAQGLATVALTGQTGGRLKDLADILIAAPMAHTPRVQEAHAILYHALAAGVEAHFFAGGTAKRRWRDHP